MAARLLLRCISLLALCYETSAQVGPDPRWVNPDGSRSDFTSTFNSGNTVTLSWKTLNSSKSDLYLTHWDSTNFQWHEQIASNIDISTAGTFIWDIDVPASEIKTDNHFVLRFYPLNSAYTVLQFDQRASPGFLLTGGTNSTSSSTTTAGTTKTTSTATSTTATSSTSAQSTSTPTTTATASNSGLSVGAQAGIGVGAGIFIIALFIAGCFFGRRFGIGRTLRRNNHENEAFLMQQNNGGKQYNQLQEKPANEIASDTHQPRVELGGTNIYPAEKSSVMVRPGVHEIA